MNANELRDKTPDQLRDELAEPEKRSFNLRFQQATGQMENTCTDAQVPVAACPCKTILEPKSGSCRRLKEESTMPKRILTGIVTSNQTNKQ